MSESRIVYSPAQVFWGRALLGVALATVYSVASNCRALGSVSEAKRFQFRGYNSSSVFIVILALDTQTGPNSIIHLLVACLASITCRQLSSKEKETSIFHKYWLAWQVVRLGLAFLSVSFLVFFLVLAIASSLTGET